MPPMFLPSDKAALRGEPSYVWRAGQARRLAMILAAAPATAAPRVLDNGCGLGVYMARLREALATPAVFGLEYERERAAEANRRVGQVVCAAGEALPYPDASFDLILSNEVIEHVQDDRAALAEMARVLRPGGRALIFCPNRWYPVETHGIYWRGRYHFGNIPLVNYLPDPLRNRLAPHVRIYTAGGLRQLFAELPLRVVHLGQVYPGYDKLAAHRPALGALLRRLTYALERTPLQRFGLSHLLVLERPSP